MQQRGLLTQKEYVELNLGTFFEGWGLHGRVPFFKLLPAMLPLPPCMLVDPLCCTKRNNTRAPLPLD